MRSGMVSLILVLSATLLAGCAGGPGYGDRPGTVTGTGSVYDQSPRCTNCGTVTAIEPAGDEGLSPTAGTVIGAVVGGLVGSQVGSGSGQDVATGAGAVGGAMAGSEIAEGGEAGGYYQVTVDMDAGGERVVNVVHPRGLTVGTQVKVVGNDLHVVEP